MKPHLALVATAAALLLACERTDHDAHEGEARSDAAAEHSHEAEAASPDTVAIDPEMLRDLRITTASAEARTGGEGVTVLGEVSVNEDAYSEVGLAIAATVIEVLAAPGAVVTRGQPLAVLESPDLGRARARAQLAHSALERKRELVQDGIVAGRELHEAEAEAAAADAELRAALGGGGAELDKGSVGSRFTLRAPIAGTVLERSIVRGQTTEPGRALFRIAELARLWLTVHAFERDAVRVAPGAGARVGLAALPGRSVAGTVTLVGSQVDTSSRTIPIRIEVENKDGALRPGMSASAWIPLGGSGQTIVAVPAAALQRGSQGWSVFVPRREGVFEVRAVGRGRDLGGEVEVLSGLAPGEVVVVEGAFLLEAEREKARGEGGHHDH